MKILAWLAVFLLAVLVSCTKDEVPGNTFSDTVSPNSVGDYWKYSIHSFTGEKKGFLEVNVIRKVSLPDGRSVATWIYSYPDFTDTVYKILSDTSLEEYRSFPITPGIPEPSMRYVFPMDPGNKWAISPSQYSDSVVVKADTTISVPAGLFVHSKRLDFIPTHFIGNYWNSSHFWITANVGIIRMEYAVYSMGYDEHYGVYELLEFRLK